MEKNEFQVVIDEVREMIAEGRLEEAAAALDEVGWSRLHNVNALVKGGELYEQLNRPEDARELFLLAHDRSPIGRMAIYHLAMISLKMEEYQKAQDYYDEFVEIAPHDSLRYVIRYRLAQAKGASDETLISILEELKEEDFLEDWAFELALLYQKTGQTDKCTDLCDEIIVWFGEGPYVEKALELKRMYRPLDAGQEEQLRRIRSQEMQELTAREDDAAAGDVPEIPVPSPRFNTVNLQKEIEKSIEEILQAKSTESVTENMEAIKELVDAMPYLQATQETREMQLARSEEEQKRTAEPAESEHAAEKATVDENGAPDAAAEALSEASHAVRESEAAEELQAPVQTGVPAVDDVLAEWEQTRLAAEAALEAANNEKLQSAKEQALAEANEILARLAAIIPKLEAGATHDELIDEGNELRALEGDGPVLPPSIQARRMPTAAPETDTAAEDTEAVNKEVSGDEASDAAEDARTAAAEAPESGLAENSASVTADAADGQKTGAVSAGTAETPDGAEANAAATQPPTGHTQRMPRLFEQPRTLTEEEQKKGLTESQMRYFSNFASLEGMEEQVAAAIRGLRESIRDTEVKNDSLLICGKPASGKSALAVSILKVLQEEVHFPKGPVGKVDGDQLNGKDIFQLFDRIRGGALIIEKAGAMERATVAALNALLDTDQSGVIVVAEDDAQGMEAMLAYNPAFTARFTHRINIPSVTIDELVNFGRTYAEENGCKIDEMGVLALYNHLNLLQRQGTLVSMGTVRNIVDDAITRANGGGLFGLVGRIGARHRDDAGRLLLHEKDFEK